MPKKSAFSGKKFVEIADALLLDKIPKMWYNGSSAYDVRLRPGQCQFRDLPILARFGTFSRKKVLYFKLNETRPDVANSGATKKRGF